MMADFTYTVYELQQNNFDFGLNDYPIFKEEYRTFLNESILNHYKFREIGFQNPALWRDRLRTRMSRIMSDKYNLLYQNKYIDFNPLFNVDMTETYIHEVENTATSKAKDTTKDDVTSSIKGTNTSTNTSETENSGSETTGTTNYGSQYPSEEMLTEDIYSNIYVDGMTRQKGNKVSESKDKKTDSTTNNIDNATTENATGERLNEQTGTGNTKETYTRKTLGSSAGLSFNNAMMQFKKFVEQFDLDYQVILELNDLFMNVWEV